MDDYIIKTTQLTKKFSEDISVNQLSIGVKKNEIYGFLGPNGAGKSTTMKLLLGLLQATHGNIELFGQPLKGNETALLQQVGSLIEEPSYYANLTGYENLELVQKLLHLPKENIQQVLEIVKLYEQKDKLVKHYSLGMKQRLGIALALIKFPKLLILDEPTNGLDPSGIQEMRELIRSLPQQYDMTVIVSSHILSEIEQMATTVGIINHGQLLFEGQLKDLEEEEKYLFQTSNQRLSAQLLLENGFEVDSEQELLVYDTNKEQIAEAVKLLVSRGLDIYQVQLVRKSLEEVFLEMTAEEE